MQPRRRRIIIRDVTTPAATSARDPEDVILRDGSTLRLRPPQPDDERELIEFFDGLSPTAATCASTASR